jgi:multiple antibiotic resistance protein
VTNVHQILQAIITVLAVINPVVCGSLFLNLTPNLTAPERRRAALKVALNILVILAGAALIGLKVLSVFGISLDVFRVVGGMIIAYMGFDMLRGGHRVAQAPPENGDTSIQGSLVPLLMFAAGPGTITAVVTLAAVHTPDDFPMTAIIAVVVGTAVTFVALTLAVRLGPRLGRGTQATVTRFMGLIVASMGMQFVLVGLKAFFEA